MNRLADRLLEWADSMEMALETYTRGLSEEECKSDAIYKRDKERIEDLRLAAEFVED